MYCTQIARQLWMSLRDVMQAFDELSLAAIRLRLRDSTGGQNRDNASSKASATASDRRSKKRAEIDRLKKTKDVDLIEKFGTIAPYEVIVYFLFCIIIRVSSY